MLPTLRTRTNWPSLVEEFLKGDLMPNFFDTETRYSLPAVNIVENKDDYRIEVAAPGLNKDDFKVNLENNVLTVSSEKEEKRDDNDERIMRREFSYASFERSFTLPVTVDADKIKANHKDGILQITIPKKEEAKQKPLRQIKVA